MSIVSEMNMVEKFLRWLACKLAPLALRHYVACPAFFHALFDMDPNAEQSSRKIPVMDSILMVAFIALPTLPILFGLFEQSVELKYSAGLFLWWPISIAYIASLQMEVAKELQRCVG